MLLYFSGYFVKIRQIPDLVIHGALPAGFVLRQTICHFQRQIGWLQSLVSAFPAKFIIVEVRLQVVIKIYLFQGGYRL